MKKTRGLPVEPKVYRYKNKNRNFFCPLCRTERNVTTSPRLTKKNYLQIVLTSIIIGTLIFPVFGVESAAIFFVVWGAFELAIRSDYKKQIPCPHCGFDATSYKRDVKVARQEVAQFWANKQPVIPSVSTATNKPS